MTVAWPLATRMLVGWTSAWAQSAACIRARCSVQVRAMPRSQGRTEARSPSGPRARARDCHQGWPSIQLRASHRPPRSPAGARRRGPHTTPLSGGCSDGSDLRPGPSRCPAGPVRRLPLFPLQLPRGLIDVCPFAVRSCRSRCSGRRPAYRLPPHCRRGTAGCRPAYRNGPLPCPCACRRVGGVHRQQVGRFPAQPSLTSCCQPVPHPRTKE